jgi:RNA polymerase-binding protein DksA
MNEAQLAFFKARLQQLEKDLLKNADETTEHLRETVLVPDPADRATIEEEHALELRTRDRERKLLKKVQQSIVSIDNGEYGWCEETVNRSASPPAGASHRDPVAGSSNAANSSKSSTATDLRLAR